MGFVKPGEVSSSMNWLADTAYEMLRLAGFTRRGMLGGIYLNKDRTEFDYALIIASTDWEDRRDWGVPRRPPPQQEIDRLKALLNLDVNPRWFYSADDDDD